MAKNSPKSDDYNVPTDPDNKGFTVDPGFSRKHAQQREKVERMEEDFLAELKKAFRENKSQLAREFLEYGQRNPGGERVKSPGVWGGDVGAEYTGMDRFKPEDEE